MPEVWSQKGFDDALKELLSNCDSKTWPRTINKKGFFVALSALKHTERANPEKIFHELGREITAKREDGTSGPLPVSIAIAAKRASKSWTRQGDISGHSKAQKAKAIRSLSLKAWRAQISKKLASMLRGRGVSSGFIKAGWVGVLKELGPKIGGRYDRGAERNVRGIAKGSHEAATPGKLQVTIINTAAARSDHRGGFVRVGEPPLQRAIDEEGAKTQEYLDDMKGDIEHFNRRQH